MLEGKLAVIFSVIIIPHASVHRPRRWRALRPVRYIFWMLLKENCDTTCSPVSNTPVSSYDGVTSICRFFIVSLAWKVITVFFCFVGLMLGTHGLEQWGFFSVPHLFWHGTFVYNVRLRGPVTLTLIAERLAAELSLPVFTTSSVRLGFEHPTFRMRGEHYEPWPLRHGREVCLHKEWDTYGMRCIGFGFVFWIFL